MFLFFILLLFHFGSRSQSICNYDQISASKPSKNDASSPFDVTFDAVQHIPLHIPALDIPLKNRTTLLATGNVDDNPKHIMVVVDHGMLDGNWKNGVEIHRTSIVDVGCEPGCGRCDAGDHCVECNNGMFLSDGKCHEKCMVGDNVVLPHEETFTGGLCVPCRKKTDTDHQPHATIDKVHLKTNTAFVVPATMTFELTIHRDDVTVNRGKMMVRISSGHVLFKPVSNTFCGSKLQRK